MRYRLQRHDGTDCSATMVPITVLRMVPIQRYRQYIIALIWICLMNFLDKLYSLEIGTFMFQFLMNQVSGLSIL